MYSSSSSDNRDITWELITHPKIILVCRTIRCCRLVLLDEELLTLYDGCITIAPVFFELMMFAFTFTYIFAMIGFILFGNHVQEWNSVLHSYVTGLCLFLPSNFVQVMESTMEATHTISGLFCLIISHIKFEFISHN